MKIGILTFHRAHNYGAMLQAYATKTFISSQRYGDVKIMDYEPENLEYGYAVFDRYTFRKLNILKKIKFLIRKNPLWMWRKRFRRQAFISFYNKYLSPFWNKDEQLDILIYGSDQIWNIDEEMPIDQTDLCYWGDGTLYAKNKIAYSASMGIVKLSPLLDNVVSENIKNFNAVSVRESTLRDYIHSIAPNVDVQVTVDPVFLLSRQQWEKIIPSHKPKEKYILVYNLRGVPIVDELANRIQLQTEYEIKRLTFDVSTFRKNEYLDLADPITFLWLIKNAEYVVASSFHGIAFSIIFHTPFYASLPNHSLRIKSLLKIAGLEDCWFEDSNIPLGKNIINWEKIDTNMKKMIIESKKYLTEAIQMAFKK